MKKILTLVIAVIFGIGTMFANPVDVNTAKSLGQMFAQANFEKNRNADLQLYYTVTSDNGQPCAYVFNIGNEGFVIVAASDNVRPILGYSEEGAFDATNPYCGAMYMLETYKNSISYAIEKNINATTDVEAEWKSLANCGKLSNKKGGTVGPLVQTKWNQDSPYNLYAPNDANGPGGRCYAGCVATAMSQVMRYWDHPTQGTGSHSYYWSGYGQQSANFGATTYQWDLMPKTLSNASQEEIEAVAKLMYHCGVAVNMQFAPDGSGAFSADVPPAMATYFDYAYCVQKQRSQYSLADWIGLLKDEFNLGRPVYYSGQSISGGHAFVCDGYDENDLMHYNWGWSGSSDGWFAVDAIDYATSAAAIFNYVPTHVYNNTVAAPSNVSVVRTNDLAQEATITWTNPTMTMGNEYVSSYDQIVVTRDGKVIYTADNPTPGEEMSFVDSNVPCYSKFEYKVFTIKDGVKGVSGSATESFGPKCEWNLVATSISIAGWDGACLVAYDGAGKEIYRFTATSSNSVTELMNLPLGKVSLVWKAGVKDVLYITFKIKDSTGATIYQYEGNSFGVPEGVLYTGNNSCGNAAPTEIPTDLHANVADNGENIILTWEGTAKSNYGFNIYRDGLLCGLARSNEFVDEAPSLGGHCYQVCVLGDGGESELSNEVCGTAGEGCDAAKNEWYYTQSNGKPVITWELPDNTDGLEAFFIYRKVNEDGEYERAKIVAANKTEYKETRALEAGNWYYYRVIAYYKANDCYAAPAKSMYGNDYFVKIYFGTEGVDDNMAQGIEMYPNPVKDVLTVKAEALSNVAVYNSLGQKVFEQDVDSEETTINTNNFEAGIYIVRIITNGDEVTRKISIVR